MIEFIRNNIACDILVLLGILSWAITIGARIESKKTGRYVSGIPAVGGILIIIGFLTSSVKWLAVIGLLDPSLLYLIFVVIPGGIRVTDMIKKWTPSEEFDGARVAGYTRYNKCYEEVHGPTEYPGSFTPVYRINRYIIVEADDGYELLGVQNTDRVITRTKHPGIEACKKMSGVDKGWNEV